MNKQDTIYVAGHTGLVGSALVRELEREGYENIVTATHDELDLTDQAATYAWFEKHRPDYVFLAAAKVGGIGANSSQPAEFLSKNLAISHHVIEAARAVGVKKLVNLGSSCIYPRDAEQPIREEALLTGALEPTNEPYAIAKIAALKLCEANNAQHGTNFISLMPTNLYGPGDNYDPETSHVLPALIAKFHSAKASGDACVELWGDGSPLREFLYVDDLAQAALFAMDNFEATEYPSWINVGSGQEVAIGRLANIVREVVFADEIAHGEGNRLPQITWDTSKPNGTPRKLLDSSRISALGWTPSTSLFEGIEATYEDYCSL